MIGVSILSRKFEAKPAEREKLKFVGMYTGADGSGKTLSAILTAKGLVQAEFPELNDTMPEFWSKIGVLDTEHRRSLIYANTTTTTGHYIGSFMHIDFEPPYDVDSYIEGVEYLKSLGCTVIIVDSLSHSWDDTGGILEVHAKLGGQFATWQKVNPIIKKFYRAVTADRDVHIISCVRAKIHYSATSTETGKMSVSKVGLKPIIRDNFEYEVLTTLHFNEDHKTTVLKDVTHLFEDNVYIEPQVGVELSVFLNEGVDINAIKEAERAELITSISSLLDKGEDAKFKKKVDTLMFTVKRQSKNKYGTEDWTELPTPSLHNIRENLEEIIDV